MRCKISKLTKAEKPSSVPAALAAKVEDYARASRAESTLKSYQDGFRLFAGWCEVHGRAVVPASPETMALFISDLAARYRPSTINRLVSAIAFAHRTAGHVFDRKSFETVMAGIRRTHGTAPRQVAAITLEDLRRIVAALPDNQQGARDRALLLVGFGGALRRAELVGLDIGERASDGTGSVELGPEGARITLHISKTDQEGKGLLKGVPRGGEPCPVRALERWLELSGITEGPIFRPVNKGGQVLPQRLTDRSVADIVKRAVRGAALAAGMTASQAETRAAQVAGHSLRAGFATSAAAANVTGENIARHVGWTSTQMTLRYVREAELFKNNPLRQILGQ
jgi:integrase